jgi:putative MATE family efflux protein
MRLASSFTPATFHYLSGRMKNVELILRGNITSYLLQHTLTIFVGLLALSSLALIDLYFIGQVGSEELAAVSFAAPILLFCINLLLSVGAALMIVVSKFVGKADTERTNRISSAGMYLSVFVGVAVFAMGSYYNDTIFGFLNADESLIRLIRSYMFYMYLAFILLALMIASTNVMRAFGDVRIPTIVMATVVVLNLVLDPILIFGWQGIPAMGLNGAALATTIAIAVGLIVSLIFVVQYIKFVPRSIIYFWDEVIKVAVPVTFSKTMLPFANGVITSMLALFGPAAVTAYGVGYRVDLLVLLFMMAMSIVVAPFVGQNFGAGNYQRIRECIKRSLQFSIIYGISAAIIIFFVRFWIGRQFSDDPDIISSIGLYLMIVPIGYFLNGIFYIGNAVLDTLNRPMIAAVITFGHLFALYLPMASIGNRWYGEWGIFAAYPISSLIATVVVLLVVKNTVDNLEQKMVKSKSSAETPSVDRPGS